ncbi:hypothetical protein SAMN02745127_02096 [Oceanospirillum multiglobuliferum]|uniref:Uncharacterized protein n=1 Tax=Oceanospirillum multiglobuliferum TaxID=64969 RepID=A0A1T4QZH4_9GAMM|nr:hypothetical protein [Oceanospirillum multiglobuliferum]OPX57044.1 hypothetical protein BTE48_01030 [Oceanospirillum multiglobuliferum]SKA09006.1 hypothetical protein SAMN02745127_02096 [Oceanospirillum multiglobuliferum]
MCDCITDIEKQATAKLQQSSSFKKPVREVRMKGIVYPLTDRLNIGMVTCNFLEVELEGQKKRHEMSISHSFCPFCGEKYEKGDSGC